MKKRIISKLEIKGPNLVKGINLEGLRVLGKPSFFAKSYYQDGIDELFYMDVVASLYGRNSLLNFIKLTAKNIFIPLTVGGGIKTLKDIRAILRSGADKVAINSEAIKNKNLIKEAVQMFGSSTIVLQILAQKKLNGKYCCFIENGRQSTDIDPVDWAIEAEKMGVGEIIINAIHKDGTGSGFDDFLVKEIVKKTNIPVIASGGAGSYSNIKNIFTETKVDAVCISSMFHYDLVKKEKKNLSSQKFSEGNIEFLKKNFPNYKGESCSIRNLKNFLSKNSVDCRLV